MAGFANLNSIGGCRLVFANHDAGGNKPGSEYFFKSRRHDVRGLAGFPTSALVGDFTGGATVSF